MATNYANDNTFNITTLESVPTSSALTGTITVLNTSTAVTGTGTLFLTEILGIDPANTTIAPPAYKGKGYLWDTAHGEFRVITDIVSQTLLFIKQPFTNSLAGATVKFIPASRLRSISWTDASGSGGGTVNNKVLAANEGGGFQEIDYIEYPLDPIIVNGTGGTVAITIAYV